MITISCEASDLITIIRALSGNRESRKTISASEKPKPCDEVTTQIVQLREKGMNMKQISAEHEKGGNKMSYGQVRGKLANVAKPAKPPELSETDITWIKDLREMEWTTDEIVTELTANGVPVTAEKVMEVSG